VLVFQTQVEAKIAEVIEPSLASMGYELVRVKVMRGKGEILQIMLDRVDGLPIAIEDCESASRQISAIMDVEDCIKSAYRLEVSSAGLDRPLTREKDFQNYVGEQVKLTTFSSISGRRRFNGTMMGIESEHLKLVLPDTRESVLIPLSNIQEAYLVMSLHKHKAN
jgi:ribosome maturation factor RimP